MGRRSSPCALYLVISSEGYPGGMAGCPSLLNANPVHQLCCKRRLAHSDSLYSRTASAENIPGSLRGGPAAGYESCRDTELALSADRPSLKQGENPRQVLSYHPDRSHFAQLE